MAILTVGGRPLSQPLRNVRSLTTTMIDAFVTKVAPCATLPVDALDGDVSTVTRACLEFAVTLLDGDGTPDSVAVGRLGAAATQWAREGIPIDTILHAIHEGCRIGHHAVVDSSSDKDFDSITAASFVLIQMLDTVTSTVAVAYLREQRIVGSEHHTAAHTLTAALLSGRPAATMALHFGIPITATYSVLAVSIPPHTDESKPQLNRDVVARRKLRRVQSELAHRCHGHALSLLSVDGGTILLPDGHDGDLSELIEALSTAARVPVTATTIRVATEDIPDGRDQTHQLLDVVRRLRLGPGLHRFDDLAVEFQLARPGPGRRHLESLLDPIAGSPELLDTLRAQVANDYNRRVSARELHVHVNTLAYRLKKVRRLTGLDPADPSDLWHLRAALVARELSESERRPQ